MHTDDLRFSPGAGAPGASPIPVMRVRDRLDSLTAKKDYDGAARLLKYWQDEARAARDLRGEFFVLNEMMGVFRKADDPVRAMECADAALRLIPLLNSGDTAAAGTAYVNAGTVCVFCGEPEKGLGHFKKAQEIYERTLDPGDSRLAGLFNNMALALKDLGRHDEAMERFSAALGILRGRPSGELEIAITLLNMAETREEALGYEEAEDEIFALLEEAEALLDPSRPNGGAYYAFVCEKCAPVFLRYGWFRTANALAQAAEINRSECP